MTTKNTITKGAPNGWREAYEKQKDENKRLREFAEFVMRSYSCTVLADKASAALEGKDL